MKKNFNRLGLLLCFVTLSCSCATKLLTKPNLQFYSYQASKMGTIFKLDFYADVEKKVADSLANKAFELVDKLNQAFSDYHPESELSQLNLTAGKGAFIRVSHPLWDILKLSVEASKQTNGAFDITTGAYVKLWRRARRQMKLPSKELMEKAAEVTGFQHILFDETNQAIKLAKEGMKLDLGGIAKGYTADQLLDFFNKHGIKSVLIDAGGDLRTGSAPPQKKGWTIEIEHGKKEKMQVLVKNKAIATSGDLFNFIDIDNVRYSHIVDPFTGLGITNRITVTIIASNGTISDYLASAISVMGLKKGKKFGRRLEDVDVIILSETEKRSHFFSTFNFIKLKPN